MTLSPSAPQAARDGDADALSDAMASMADGDEHLARATLLAE